jgi:hypothetical protein
MAAKDWKKTPFQMENEEKDWMSYKARTFLKIRLIERNSYYSTHWFKSTDKYMVVLTAMDWPMSIYERKGFKTKTEALEYAKAYMRSH